MRESSEIEADPASEPPPGRRGASSVLYTLVGFVAGSLAMLGGLALLHAQVLERDRTMSSVSSSEGDLAALEEHIPTSILATCHEGNMREETQDSVIASVTCTPGIQQGNDLQYMKAHDTLAVRTLFRTRAEQYVGSELASGEDAVSTCATRTPGQFRWYALRMPNDSSGVVERVFHRTEDTTSGLAMCYSEDGMAWLEWVDLDTQIYAFASTPVEFYPLLYDWWLQEAGPNHPMGNMAPTDTNSTGPSGPADPEM